LAFSSFIEKWKDLLEDRPDWEKYIKPGVEKLEEYQWYLDEVPAYTVAMGNVVLYSNIFNLAFTCFYSLGPTI
jgi:hypothetical protein